MKRITAALTALAVIIGLGTSCQKEMENRQEISGSGTGLKVTATIADNGTKVSYQEDGTSPNPGLQPAWEVGDIIIGFDGNDETKTYGYEVTEINDNGVATLAIITEGDNKGTATADPADGTKMYMFYAPGTTPDKISGKSLTVSLTTQAKDVVPAIMMAQATVANGSLSLQFSNQTAIIGVKAPVMVDKNKSYTSLALSGSTGLNTEIKFDLDGDKNLKASYQTPGTLTKELNFTSNSETGKGPDVIYIVACPADQQNLSFKFNGTEEYFNVENVEIKANNYYRLEAPSTEKQKFAITVADGIQNGTITTNPSGSVAWGTEVTVSAAPSEGYELATLTYNDGTNHDIKDDKSFNMPQKNVTVSGTFQLKDFAITAGGTATSGTYTVEGGTYTITKGSENVTTAQMEDVIKVEAAPTIGYSGGTVTVKKTDTDEEVTFNTTNNTFTMPAADVTITVSFTHDEYGITGNVTTESSGSVTFKKSGSDNITKAFYGDAITVEDAPATGYELVSITWTQEGGTATDITTDKTFTMPAKAVTVTVAFKKTDYAITATGTETSGKYTVTGGSYIVKNSSGTAVTTAQMDDEITIAATPDAGYVVDAITVKGADDSGVTVTNGTFTMPAKAVTVTVTFKAQAPGSNPPDYDITTW